MGPMERETVDLARPDDMWFTLLMRAQDRLDSAMQDGPRLEHIEGLRREALGYGRAMLDSEHATGGPAPSGEASAFAAEYAAACAEGRQHEPIHDAWQSHRQAERCVQCHDRRVTIYGAQNRVQGGTLATIPSYKKCAHCGTWKLIS